MNATAPIDFNKTIRSHVRAKLIAALGLTPDGRIPTVMDRVAMMAEEANRGCGQSYDLFVERFSGLIDGAYPAGSPDREQAIAAAARFGEYATPDELAAMQEQLAEMGYCSHGIELNCCPCGCGDRED